MRILVVHRYYWPDTPPCASIMRHVAKQFAADGHTVDVLTSQPSYRDSSLQNRQSSSEQLDNVFVTRLSLPTETSQPLRRITNALRLGIRIIWRSLITRYDVIVVGSIPPVLGGFFSACAAKLTRARLIYYCMDLHPEIGRVSGDFSNAILFRVLRGLDDWTCRHAKPVLVHSEDMRTTLRERARGSEYRVDLMNSFSLPRDDDSPHKSDFNWGRRSHRLRLIYAGNMGRFQGLETWLDAMAQIAYRKDIELIMMGDGVAKTGLVAQRDKTNANVRFFDYQPVEVVRPAIKSSDLGVVSLIPEIYRYAYPSKTMAYLEEGRPIIATVETQSELSKTMMEEGYGFTAPIGNPCALANFIVQLANDLSWRKPMNQAASVAFETHFSASIVLAKWSHVVGRP